MPAALNITPGKKGAIEGFARHAMRLGKSTSKSDIDPSKSHRNKYMAIDKNGDLKDGTAAETFEIYKAAIDVVQPLRESTKRKLGKNTNWSAQVIATLPIEIDRYNPEALGEWARITVKFLQTLPGKTLYIAIHLDETTPHIHMAKLPANKENYLNYKAMYTDRNDFRRWQNEYSELLKPLGVKPASKAEKAIKARGYVTNVEDLKKIRTAAELNEYNNKRSATMDSYVEELNIGIGILKMAYEEDQEANFINKAISYLQEVYRHFRPEASKTKTDERTPG